MNNASNTHKGKGRTISQAGLSDNDDDITEIVKFPRTEEGQSSSQASSSSSSSSSSQPSQPSQSFRQQPPQPPQPTQPTVQRQISNPITTEKIETLLLKSDSVIKEASVIASTNLIQSAIKDYTHYTHSFFDVGFLTRVGAGKSTIMQMLFNDTHFSPLLHSSDSFTSVTAVPVAFCSTEGGYNTKSAHKDGDIFIVLKKHTNNLVDEEDVEEDENELVLDRSEYNLLKQKEFFSQGFASKEEISFKVEFVYNLYEPSTRNNKNSSSSEISSLEQLLGYSVRESTNDSNRTIRDREDILFIQVYVDSQTFSRVAPLSVPPVRIWDVPGVEDADLLVQNRVSIVRQLANVPILIPNGRGLDLIDFDKTISTFSTAFNVLDAGVNGNLYQVPQVLYIHNERVCTGGFSPSTAGATFSRWLLDPRTVGEIGNRDEPIKGMVLNNAQLPGIELKNFDDDLKLRDKLASPFRQSFKKKIEECIEKRLQHYHSALISCLGALTFLASKPEKVFERNSSRINSDFFENIKLEAQDYFLKHYPTIEEVVDKIFDLNRDMIENLFGDDGSLQAGKIDYLVEEGMPLSQQNILKGLREQVKELAIKALLYATELAWNHLNDNPSAEIDIEKLLDFSMKGLLPEGAPKSLESFQNVDFRDTLDVEISFRRRSYKVIYTSLNEVFKSFPKREVFELKFGKTKRSFCQAITTNYLVSSPLSPVAPSISLSSSSTSSRSSSSASYSTSSFSRLSNAVCTSLKNFTGSDARGCWKQAGYQFYPTEDTDPRASFSSRVLHSISEGILPEIVPKDSTSSQSESYSQILPGLIEECTGLLSSDDIFSNSSIQLGEEQIAITPRRYDPMRKYRSDEVLDALLRREEITQKDAEAEKRSRNNARRFAASLPDPTGNLLPPHLEPYTWMADPVCEQRSYCEIVFQNSMKYSDGFKLFIPEEVKAKVEELYGSDNPNNARVPLMFIPSKGRASSLKLPTDLFSADAQPTISFIFVEAPELNVYMHEYSRKPQSRHFHYFVRIPGPNRGIAFSRNLILMFIEKLNKLVPGSCKEFGMIDDDIQYVEGFYRCKFSRTHLDFVLKQMRACLRMEQQSTDIKRDEKKWNDLVDDFLIKSGEMSPTPDSTSMSMFVNLLNSNSTPVKDAVRNWDLFELDCTKYCQKFFDVAKAKVKNHVVLQALIDKFKEFLENLNQHSSSSQIALQNVSAGRFTSYNHFDYSCTHRVSSLRYAVVISNFAAVSGAWYCDHGRLEDIMFASDEEINSRIIECTEATGNVRTALLKKYFFIGEDVEYIENLRKMGRGGFSYFKAQALYSQVEKGGCFWFRHAQGMVQGS